MESIIPYKYPFALGILFFLIFFSASPSLHFIERVMVFVSLLQLLFLRLMIFILLHSSLVLFEFDREKHKMAGTWILGVICFFLSLSTTYRCICDEIGILLTVQQKYPWQFKCYSIACMNDSFYADINSK